MASLFPAKDDPKALSATACSSEIRHVVIFIINIVLTVLLSGLERKKGKDTKFCKISEFYSNEQKFKHTHLLRQNKISNKP